MDFENASPYPAELIRSALSPDDSEPMLAVVVLKVTYLVEPGGALRLAPEQVPVTLESVETELGVLPPDAAPIKPGFDVMVLGRAVPPEGKPVPAMTVRLTVGAEVRELAVFGNRRWVRNEIPEKERKRKRKKDEPEPAPTFSATVPEPFVAMPLTYANAYGGNAKVGVYEAPNPYNLEGKGFCMDPAFADGVELPNVENPRELIRTWEDQPRPVGFAPLPLGTLYTVERGVEHDAENNTQTVRPEVFQNAHPDLVFPEVPPGTEVAVAGMTPDAAFAFRLPDLRASVTVRLEDREYRPAGKVDTLMIFPDEGRIVVLHRTPFKYRVIPEEIRTARLEVEHTGAAS